MAESKVPDLGSKPSAKKTADPAKKEAPKKKKISTDARYSFDAAALDKLRKEVPWTKTPAYFEKVAVSPSAVMKIMMHCQSGVEKGINKGGNPLEVMGMLLGRPDPTTPKTLVVTDAFPLPIEGFETRVVADDADVTNHMIALGESLELTRQERFMGWYHSHPFDVADHSHCFLSQTDLTTQLQWQRAEDPHGNPFVAIVVDPLRSLDTNQPVLKAFRAYPPEHANDTCPDGSKQPHVATRLALWGSCWNRYYELQVEYFMSKTSLRTMQGTGSSDGLWMRALQAEPFRQEPLKKLSQEIAGASEWEKTALPRLTDMAIGELVQESLHDAKARVFACKE